MAGYLFTNETRKINYQFLNDFHILKNEKQKQNRSKFHMDDVLRRGVRLVSSVHHVRKAVSGSGNDVWTSVSVT